MEKRRIYIGTWEISWNRTTWRDWLPFTVVVVSLSLIAIGMGIHYAMMQ
jgi:hypothetical protein